MGVYLYATGVLFWFMVVSLITHTVLLDKLGIPFGNVAIGYGPEMLGLGEDESRWSLRLLPVGATIEVDCTAAERRPLPLLWAAALAPSLILALAVFAVVGPAEVLQLAQSALLGSAAFLLPWSDSFSHLAMVASGLTSDYPVHFVLQWVVVLTLATIVGCPGTPGVSPWSLIGMQLQTRVGLSPRTVALVSRGVGVYFACCAAWFIYSADSVPTWTP